MQKIDLTSSRTLTILAIVCVLIFACVYIMVIRKDNIEGLDTVFPVESGDKVRLKDGLSSVLISTGQDTAITAINSLIDTKIRDLIPAFSIVAFNGNTAPIGWQICNGDPLLYDDNTTPYNPAKNTPDLRGRTIIGVNTSQFTDTTSNVITIKTLNAIGGEENHALTIPEMPSHNHLIGNELGNNGPNIASNTGGSSYYTLNPPGAQIQSYKNIQNLFSVGFTGGDPSNNNQTKPHNNMQPYLVLNYIIKQPKKP